MSSTANKPSILATTVEAQTIAPGVHLLPSQGNGLAIETAKGVVIVDAGPGGEQTAEMIAQLRTFTDAPVYAIAYSHGHFGYNTGVGDWNAHLAAEGHPEPERIAQENIVPRFARYRETQPAQFRFNLWQFPRVDPEVLRGSVEHTDPTITFSDRYVIDDPDRPIHLLSAPSETDDSVAVWLPEQRILWGGPAVITGFPNIGSPQRTQRYTQRWIKTLEDLIDLEPEILIPEFEALETTVEAARERLVTTADALRYLWDETIRLMNTGLTDVEILAEIEYPESWNDHPYLVANYGNPDYVVRDIYREQNGWWVSRNVTDLHPASPDAAAAAIASAVDPERVVARARELHEAGEHQLALHVIDVVALAPGDDPILLEARALKGEAALKLAKASSTLVSRNLYFGAAALHGAGLRRTSEAPMGPSVL